MTSITSTNRTHIVTIGDSTLDNLIWMDKNKITNKFPIADSVIGQLRNDSNQVTNFAADGFTSSHVLEGALPMLSREAWSRAGEPFPSDNTSDGILQPLLELEKLNQINPVTHVVLSVGGNDIRVILQQMHNLPTVVSTFIQNYKNICNQILQLNNIKLIIVLQYQVCLTHEHGGYGVYTAMSQIPGPGTGQQKLQQLMERIYAPILNYAQEHRLAVIDLPRTFNPSDASLYRLQIEPSKKGGALIAKVVKSCIETHDFSAVSKLYSTNFETDHQVRSEDNVFTLNVPWKIVRTNRETSGDKSFSALASPEVVRQTFDEQHAHIEALPQAVFGLMEMGFKEADVKKALLENGNVPQAALEVLLSEY